MSDPRHDRISQQLVDYALDELTPAERRDVDAHLRECDACVTELEGITESIALLADTAPPQQLPPALKDRVLSAVAMQPQEPAVRTASTAVKAGKADSTRSQATSRRLRWLPLAAAIMLVALAATLYLRESSRRSIEQDAQRASAEVTSLRERLQRFSAQTDLALSILTASDMREVPLAGRDTAAAAAARAYWSPTRGLLLVADRLPAAPPGRIYQVWVIDSGQPTSAGLLGEPGSGRGMLVAPPPQPGSAGTVTIAVTDEPPGGLPAPSGTIRLAGST